MLLCNVLEIFSYCAYMCLLSHIMMLDYFLDTNLERNYDMVKHVEKRWDNRVLLIGTVTCSILLLLAHERQIF